MDLSKLSTALTPVNLADTALVTISPTFKIRICPINKISQVYNEKLAAFAKANPKHKSQTNPNEFFMSLFDGQHSKETVQFAAHVVCCGWELTDNDGEDVPFSAQNATQLLHTKVGHTIFGRLMQAALIETTFQIEWSDDAIKNL